MSLSRPMTPFEKWFHGMECFVQVGFDISEPSYITQMIDQIGDAVPALHLRSDGKTLFQTNDPFIVEEIPKGLSTSDAAQWLVMNRQPKQSERLAVIGANRDKLVLSMSHMCGDGGYLVHLVNKVCSGDINPTGWSLMSVEEMFSKQMKMHGASAKATQVDDSATRLYPVSKLPVDPKKWVLNKEMIFPAKSLMCYNKGTGKLHGLTETLWTGIILSSFAFNNKIGPIGCSTCVNMRKYLPTGTSGFNTGNCYSSITVGGPPVKRTTTIGEVAASMRSDFNDKLKRGMHYEYFNAMMRDWNLPGIGGAVCEVSNVGQMHINDPVKDVHVTLAAPDSGCVDVFTAISYSVISKHSNNVAVQLTHAPSVMTDKEFRKLQASLKYFATNVPFTANVFETISTLRKVQESTQ